MVTVPSDAPRLPETRKHPEVDEAAEDAEVDDVMDAAEGEGCIVALMPRGCCACVVLVLMRRGVVTPALLDELDDAFERLEERREDLFVLPGRTKREPSDPMTGTRDLLSRVDDEDWNDVTPSSASSSGNRLIILSGFDGDELRVSTGNACLGKGLALLFFLDAMYEFGNFIPTSAVSIPRVSPACDCVV